MTENAETSPVKKRSLARKIINGFIALSAAIIFLLLVFLGFSQTSTFREFLRKEIMSQVNPTINGRLFIGEIDGTIFTLIRVRQSSMTVRGDSLFSAKDIELRFSPLALLKGQILVKDLRLKDVRFFLTQNAQGLWTTDDLSKDRTKSKKKPFPFSIQANSVRLENVYFLRKTHKNLGFKRSYDNLNTDDLEVRDICMSTYFQADVNANDFFADINFLSLRPNIKGFSLRGLSGEVHLTERYIKLKKLKILTDKSEIGLSAECQKLNIFGSMGNEEMRHFPIKASLNSSPIVFQDLGHFIPALNMIKAKAKIDLELSGSISELKIQRLRLAFLKSSLNLSGCLLDVDIPDKFRIDLKTTDSRLSLEDLSQALPKIGLSGIKSLDFNGLNLSFFGSPQNFNFALKSGLLSGNLDAKGSLDSRKKDLVYGLSFITDKMNLGPLLGTETRLTSRGNLQGRGIDLKTMTSRLSLSLSRSEISGTAIDSAGLSADAQNSLVNFRLSSAGPSGRLRLSGLVNTKNSAPKYSLEGDAHELNLSGILRDSSYESSLNFGFTLTGEDFDPERLSCRLKLNLLKSSLNERILDPSMIGLMITKTSEGRKISLESDFADLSLSGNFSLISAINLVSYESKTCSEIIGRKFSSLNPLEQKELRPEGGSVSPIINNKMSVAYDFKIKDLSQLSPLFGGQKLDAEASGTGKITNSPENFSISLNLSLKYLMSLTPKGILYLSDFETNLNLSRNNRINSFSSIFGALSVSGKRFYNGLNVRKINTDFVFNQSKLYFNCSSTVDSSLTNQIEGNFAFDQNRQTLDLEKIDLNYKGIDWINETPARLILDSTGTSIDGFKMRAGSSSLTVSGKIGKDGREDLDLAASGISGEILNRYFFNDQQKSLRADIDIRTSLKGTMKDPLIKLNISANDLKYESTNLGYMFCNLDYSNEELRTDFSILDSTRNIVKPELILKSSIPLNLSFSSVDERFLRHKPMHIRLNSKGFDLSKFGDLLPYVRNQRGRLYSDLMIDGNADDIIYKGNLNLKDGSFILRDNNLGYSLSLKTSFDEQTASIDSLRLANISGTEYPGEMEGYGQLKFEGFDLEQAALNLNGDLALLSPASKGANPSFYGDLVLSTSGDLLLTYENGHSKIKGDLIITDADIVYGNETQTEIAEDGLVYSFTSYKPQEEEEDRMIKGVVKNTADKAAQAVKAGTKASPLDMDLNISIEDEARIQFILSKVANQRLLVDLNGKLHYISKDGQVGAQGAFKVLPGSSLEYFKTFDAEGSISFESKITEPSLDITATYIGDYVAEESPQTQEVAVKIRLKGTVNQLGKNLADNPQNIGVYIGTRNIQNDVRDTRYDAADAVSFIVLNKFAKDLTAGDRNQLATQTNVLSNTATSLLGSVLTSYVNSAVGDIVNNIQLRQTVEATKFSVSGKYRKIRYSIGGTENVFKDLYKASLKLEYMINPNFLIRLERKDPITQTYGNEDKINEMGLKYRFEF